MEPRPNFFPVYVSGQYLTNENLNETQNFLWQEEKAARYLLSGNGIAQGLNINFSDSTSLKLVTISAGDACTCDGYIIQTTGAQSFDKGLSIQLSWLTLDDGSQQLMEKTTYDNLKDNLDATETVLDVIEIFSNNSEINDLPEGTNMLETFSITTAQVTSGYIMLGWVFTRDEENDNCVQGDCNTKGVLRNYITRYFLVRNKQFTSQNSLSPQMPLCVAARIKNLSNSGSAAGLNQASFTAWDASRIELQPYFSSTSTAKQLSIIANLLDATERSALTTAITMFSQIVSSATGSNCQQYYNGFASDLSSAINELVNYYNDFAIKYPSVSSTRIESVIILGGFTQATVDKWRYYFLPGTQQGAFVFERNRLKQLFMRAVSLVNNFIVQANIKSQAAQVAKVIAAPSVIGNDVFANRAIPYYYDVLTGSNNNVILKNWNPQDASLQNIFCYYDSIIPARSNMVTKLSVADWTNENFFRIEGHLGLAKQNAISAVSALIVNDGLPFQLLDCDVDYKGPITWNNWYNDFSVFLNDSLTQLRATTNDTSYAYDPFKKITTTNLETSYRKPDAVKTILNDLTAYSGVFYNASRVLGIKARPVSKRTATTSKKTAKKTVAAPVAAPQITTKKTLTAGLTATSPISTQVIQNFIEVVPQETITNFVKGYNDAIIEVTDPETKRLLILKDLPGLEYLGGVPRGGTFVLLHSGGTIIGDGCLSYYYRIDKNRIFDI